MSIVFILAGVLAVTIGLPVLTYYCVKFGTAGYLKAKKREEKRRNKPEI